jgi:hypothetical protein
MLVMSMFHAMCTVMNEAKQAESVQMKNLASAAEVAAKFKAMWNDMEHAAGLHAQTVHGLNPGTLTPKERFTDDTRVPVASRYSPSKEVIDLGFSATAKDIEIWSAAKKRKADRKQALLVAKAAKVTG